MGSLKIRKNQEIIMSATSTQYGIDDLQNILGAFSNLGTDIFSGESN